MGWGGYSVGKGEGGFAGEEGLSVYTGARARGCVWIDAGRRGENGDARFARGRESYRALLLVLLVCWKRKR